MMMKRLLCAVVLFAAASSVLAAETGDTLERVVIVQRHGVRSPTKPPEAYARFSSEAWPDWPVAPGILTPHGAENIRLMAGWLRGHYAGLGLLPVEGCPAGVSVWADGGDERTRDSGQAFLDGAFPGCGLIAAHGPEGQKDPVFEGAQACRPDPQVSSQALATASRALDQRKAEIEEARRALKDIVKPPSGSELDLKTEASLAETLLLEYGQGMDPAQVGWGRAPADQIAKVMLLHNLSAALNRRTPYIASHNGAVLARMILSALKGEGGETLKLIAGHDTQLSNLAGILGVSWTLPGQPDDTPPGGALAFELWRDRQGHRTVKLAFFYQPLEDMRAAARKPLGRVEVGTAVPVEAFVSQVERALPAACRKG
jgi:4-phytase/acid phosphatase